MQSVMVFGFPMVDVGGMPYVSLSLPEPVKVGTEFALGDKKYYVHQADDVTHDNQLQNVYVQLLSE